MKKSFSEKKCNTEKGREPDLQRAERLSESERTATGIHKRDNRKMRS